MIKAVLFDLDDTLLGNNVYQTFLPAYFGSLAKHMTPYLKPEKFLQALDSSTRKLIASSDTDLTNRELFWKLFEQKTGLPTTEMEPVYLQFCREEFPKLRSITHLRPSAAPLIQHCFDQNLQVVIATNPMFPKLVIEERLAWAGVPVSDFNYDLITTYDNMHNTKPNPAYYAEILAMIDCTPKSALMVGDSWENDIVPAASLGIHTYWVNEESEGQPDASLTIGRGSLADFYNLFTNDQQWHFRTE